MTATNEFFQLTYYSTAIEDLDADEVVSILQKSRVNNAANDITGCLLYHNSEFLQILEGKEESVRILFQKIQQDPRHEAVLQLAENTTSKRLFGQWSMAFHDINSPEEIAKFDNRELFISNFKGFSELVDQQGPSFDIFWGMAKHLIDS